MKAFVHLLTLPLLGYYSALISIYFPVIWGQTNLFNGYKSHNNDDKNRDGIINDIPESLMTELSNGLTMPLVGLGVGSLQTNLVESMIHHAMNDARRIRLFDTSHRYGNERECARGLSTGILNLKDQWLSLSSSSNKNRNRNSNKGIDTNNYNQKDRIQVHVVTKIWYTHLGYARTKLAVDEILQEFDEAINPNIDLRLTILLERQQSNDHLSEQQLPDRTKNAGPPPHLDENAWKGSWRALEEIYEDKDVYSVVAAIGISNFDIDHLRTLIQISKIKPHMIQINVWSLMNEPALIELINEHNIHIQVYNIMNGIIAQVSKNPKAHHHMMMIAAKLEQKSIHNSSTINTTVEKPLYMSQIVMKWLVQQGISVIPRTSDLNRLSNNSAISISRISDMGKQELNITSKSILALINKKDLEDDILVQVRFHAKESDMFLYWVSEDSHEKQRAFIEKGGSFEEHTRPGEKFKAYNAYDPDLFKIFFIGGHYGDEQDINVEL